VRRVAVPSTHSLKKAVPNAVRPLGHGSVGVSDENVVSRTWDDGADRRTVEE
jgi:hypothetical protein